MPFVIDLKLFIEREDLPETRLPERYNLKSDAENAAYAMVERYRRRNIDAEFDICEIDEEPACSLSTSS